MSQIAVFFRTAGAVLLSLITSFFAVGFQMPENIKPDDAVLTAVFLSDTHITKELYRTAIFAPGIVDISNLAPDLFVTTGDCTDNGNEENWEAFKKVLDKHLQVEHRLITFGNHDAWTSYDTPHDFEPAKENFVTYSNAIMGEEGTHDDVYFNYELNGIPFIVMGSEGTSVGAEISDTQLSWLENSLADAAARHPGKPIFVLNHQPLNFTHAVGDNEHGSGIETEGASERMIEIMDRYENVILISGHQHYGLNNGKYDYPEGFRTVEQVGEHITSVNLPSYEYGSFISGGNALIGTGVYMAVYSDKIVLAGRNFALRSWIRDFNVEIPLQG